MPEIILLIVLFAIVGEKIILPFFTQLKNNVIILLLDWRFYLFLGLMILISIGAAFYLRNKKLKRLELEKIENEAYWKKKRDEEKNMKKLYAHLEPKPKILPPFGDGTSIWKKEPEEQVSINVDLDKGFYKRKRLNKHEIEYLIEEGYKEFKYKSICTQKKENYLLKPRHNESLNHMIVIYDLAEYLQKKKIDYEMFTTRMPDIVMSFKSKNIAFEVETGATMTNMKKFREKLKLLNKNYGDNWYFIITNRNKVKKYKKFGKVIDPRYIKGQIDKIIKNARK